MNKSELLEFIQSSPVPVTKREIARAMRIKGDNRVALKQVLKQLEAEGVITKQPGGAYSVPKGMPSVTVLEVVDISVDGDMFAVPVEWDEGLQGPLPRIEVMPGKKGHPPLKMKDRILARLERVEENVYEAFVIRQLDTDRGRVLGVLKLTRGGALLTPTNKKAKFDFEVAQADVGSARDGDLAVGEILPSRGLKRKKVRIVEIIGQGNDPKAISLVSLHEAGLREEFPSKVIEETKGMMVPSPQDREDLRDIPLITIDGADARDFDDAVFAEKTPEGYHLIVAIADVAYYVRPGSALDKEAQRRGNSTYFPDRVVPMLPEALSNDLCSLRPDGPRACLAAHLWIDGNGQLTRYKFVRGLMQSRARTTYEQVQYIYDAHFNSGTAPPHPCAPLPLGEGKDLWPIIKPLYEAYRVLDAARVKRGALELDLPERQIVLDDKGNMIGVKTRARYDSHKLIEEMMILANVAAAMALERKENYPCVYRVHERPSYEKLDSAREFLESFGLSLPKGQAIKPEQINYLLKQAADLPYSHLISQVILRTQAQAHYSTKNVGHFGLALSKYAHFTSPIRRYADLLVHRALIGAYGLGTGAMDEEETVQLEHICQDISATERVSMEAERNAVDRFTAAFLSEHIGAEFEGHINGVTRFGLFVTLKESGADGLVPMKSLGDDFYVHDERAHALVGRRHGKVYRLGANVTVRLVEADGLTGSTILALAPHQGAADIPGMPLPRTFQGGKDFRHKGKKGKKYGNYRDKDGKGPSRGGKKRRR